jgi:hypothetical protein
MYNHTDHVIPMPPASFTDRMIVTAFVWDGSCGILKFPTIPSIKPFTKYGLELGVNKNPIIATHARNTYTNTMTVKIKKAVFAT